MRFFDRFRGPEQTEAARPDAQAEFNRVMKDLLKKITAAKVEVDKAEKRMATSNYTDEVSLDTVEQQKNLISQYQKEMTEACAKLLPGLRQQREAMLEQGKKTKEIDELIKNAENRLQTVIENLRIEVGGHQAISGQINDFIRTEGSAPGDASRLTRNEQSVRKLSEELSRYERALSGPITNPQQEAEKEAAA